VLFSLGTFHISADYFLALERYQPLRSGPYGTPGRFPLRNQFISDFIHETTGKRRTPKQVGSRLQQLRDTSKKAKRLSSDFELYGKISPPLVVDLISRRNAPERGSDSLTPPRSTQIPEERPMSRQGDPVNILSCEVSINHF
jgi:transcriptional enhancer factor